MRRPAERELTPMDAADRLTAVQEINDLITRYALATDDSDWESLADLWTEDAAFTVQDRSRSRERMAFEGREQVLAFLTSCVPEHYQGTHLNAPSLIALEPAGLRATARTNVVWIGQNLENTVVACYNDTLVKENGRWLFSRRDETTVDFKPGPPPLSATATSAINKSTRLNDGSR